MTYYKSLISLYYYRMPNQYQLFSFQNNKLEEIKQSLTESKTVISKKYMVIINRLQTGQTQITHRNIVVQEYSFLCLDCGRPLQ